MRHLHLCYSASTAAPFTGSNIDGHAGVGNSHNLSHESWSLIVSFPSVALMTVSSLEVSLK